MKKSERNKLIKVSTDYALGFMSGKHNIPVTKKTRREVEMGMRDLVDKRGIENLK
jgi:hypothetical protein